MVVYLTNLSNVVPALYVCVIQSKQSLLIPKSSITRSHRRKQGGSLESLWGAHCRSSLCESWLSLKLQSLDPQSH